MSSRHRRTVATHAALIAMLITARDTGVAAHSGPPIPVLTDAAIGRLLISVWVDPDATDDGTAEGRVWVVVRAGNDSPIASPARVSVAVRPEGTATAPVVAAATPEPPAARHYFARVAFAHEGRFELFVTVEEGGDQRTAHAVVAATYATRPSLAAAMVYVFPFASIGLIWIRLLIKRTSRPGGPDAGRTGAAHTLPPAGHARPADELDGLGLEVELRIPPDRRALEDQQG